MEIAASPAKPSLGRHALLSTPAEPPPALRFERRPFYSSARRPQLVAWIRRCSGRRSAPTLVPGYNPPVPWDLPAPCARLLPPMALNGIQYRCFVGLGGCCFSGPPPDGHAPPPPPPTLLTCLPAPPPQRALLRRRVRVQVRVCEYMWSGGEGAYVPCRRWPAARCTAAAGLHRAGCQHERAALATSSCAPAACCRHVVLPQDIAKRLPKNRLLSEAEWRALGVCQSRGWCHYAIHRKVDDNQAQQAV